MRPPSPSAPEAPSATWPRSCSTRSAICAARCTALSGEQAVGAVVGDGGGHTARHLARLERGAGCTGVRARCARAGACCGAKVRRRAHLKQARSSSAAKRDRSLPSTRASESAAWMDRSVVKTSINEPGLDSRRSSLAVQVRRFRIRPNGALSLSMTITRPATCDGSFPPHLSSSPSRL